MGSLLKLIDWIIGHWVEIQKLRSGPNGKKPMTLIIVGIIGAILGATLSVSLWLSIPSTAMAQTSSNSPPPAVSQSIVNSPGAMINAPGGMQAGRDLIVNPPAQPGFRLLDRKVSAEGDTRHTVFIFGSQTHQAFPRFAIRLTFTKPFDSVAAQLLLEDTHFNTNGSLAPEALGDKTSYTISSGGMMPGTKLVLEFTAPYPMEIKGPFIVDPGSILPQQ
jgi:hypothetical protein